MSDQEILESLRAGDESCLEYLYRYLGMVEAWVLKNHGYREDALDLFQEALIVFYQNVLSGSYRPKSKISTYLMSICKNQWYNVLKKRKKDQFLRSDLGYLTDTIVDPVEEVSRIDENGRPLPSQEEYLEERIEQLGERCKAIIEAAIFLKLRMEVIAERYGYASAQSARQQKLRCLNKLRKMVPYEYVMALK